MRSLLSLILFFACWALAFCQDAEHALYVDIHGNVAIGHEKPTARLHLITEGLGTRPAFRMGSEGVFSIDAPGVKGGRLTILSNGNVGIGTSQPQGKLDISGSLFFRSKGSTTNHLFKASYKPEPIRAHAAFMKKNKRLPAMPVPKSDEQGQDVIEIGVYQQGLTEELVKAHKYIEQLSKRITKLEKEVKRLKKKKK